VDEGLWEHTGCECVNTVVHYESVCEELMDVFYFDVPYFSCPCVRNGEYVHTLDYRF
jgi:hypothetical protein